MKETRYKLIKCYPGHEILGEEVWYSSTSCSDKWHGTYYYSKYPEFWEEVIEWTPEEKLSVPIGTKFTVTSAFSTDTVYTIDKIIGNRVRVSWDTDSINTGTTYSINSANNYFYEGTWRVFFPKVKLFISKDGVDIFKGDKFYILLPNNKLDTTYDFFTANETTPFPPNNGEKYFSTRESAEEYIAKQKVLFITEDGVGIKEDDLFYFISAGDTYLDRGIGQLYAKPYVTANCALKRFSTKEKAQEYIDINKPQFSKQDVINSWGYGIALEYFLKNLEREIIK